MSSDAAYKELKIEASEVRDELLSLASSTMWPGLGEAVLDYCETHESHVLSVYESGGDYPWLPDEPNWHAWRETRGPFFMPPFRETDIDLPLNIIHDLGIKNWTDALVHYKTTCPCVSHPEAMEGLFIKLLNEVVCGAGEA